MGTREDALHVQLVHASQAEAAPLSLTASDGTGLRLRELTAKVVLQPPLAFTELELAFVNDEPRRREGRFEISLPEAASISRLALQIGDRFQEGEIVERHRAQLAYEEALHGRRDPALLEHESGNRYGVRVFPIEAHETKRVIVGYSQLIAGEQGAYRLPLAGLPQIDRVRIEIDRAGSTERPRVFARRAWRPSGDLEVAMPASQGSIALVHGELALLQVRPATQSSATTLTRLTVLFDTSASRAADFDGQIERMQAIVRELARQRGAVLPVQLVVFDQEVVPLIEAQADALGADLKAQLLERGAFGATDLEAALRVLATLPDLGDRLLVFSDGMISAGATGAASIKRSAGALAARGVRRIDVATHGEAHDRAVLRALAHAELPEAGIIGPDDDAAALARRLLRGTERRVAIEIEGAQSTFPSVLEGVEPGVAYPVFVKLGPPGTPRLRLGNQRVPLTTVTASTATLLEHAWASARIEHLQARLTLLYGGDAERARAEIVELSRKHRVLSDHTALVVLESEADYARHGIARSAISDVTVVRDGALGKATEPQVAREWGAEAFALGDDGTGIAQLLGTPGVDAGLGSARYGQASGSFAEPAVSRVRSGKAKVLGGLSLEVVRRVVNRRINEVRFCYEQRLSERPRLAGEMVMRFVIGVSGNVQGATVLSSTLDDAELGKCVVAVLHRCPFPAPEDGGIVSVTYPFDFFAGNDIARQPSSPRLVRSGRVENTRPSPREVAREKARNAAQVRSERAREWERRARPTPASHLKGEMLDAIALLEVGDTAAAFARARAFQRAAPRDVMALIALARTAEGIGEHGLAARAWGSLIDLFPARPELRRAAGQGLEGLGREALALAIDSYRKAIELRPDHPSSHRLLGMALWRSGDVELARAALVRASSTPFPLERFPGLHRLLSDEIALTSRTLDAPRELLRVCAYWETDATNLDLHVYDGEQRHAASDRAWLDNGARLHPDVAAGYGPECFTATGDQIAYPYLLQAHYRSLGAMGHALGALHVLRISAEGKPSFESRPFAVMRGDAFIPLGELTRDGGPS